MTRIELRATVNGISYREVLRNGEVVAAIWGIRDNDERCFSIVTPTEEPQQVVSKLKDAERLVECLLVSSGDVGWSWPPHGQQP